LKLIDIRGFVLKEQTYKENDKIVWVLCENIGKVSILAKNAKKMKNSKFILTQPFSLVQFTLIKGKSFYYIQDGSLIKNVNFINNEDVIFYLSYFFELLDICFQDKDILDTNFFKIIMKTFLVLESNSMDKDLMMRIFEFKLLNKLGCSIEFEKCYYCSQNLKESIGYFDFTFQSVVCNSCSKLKEFKIENRIINIMRFLNKIDMRNIPRLSVTNNDMKLIFDFNKILLDQNLIRMPNSIKFLGGYE